MSKKRFLIPVLILFCIIGVQANEVSAIWGRLYSKASSPSQQFAIMTSIIEQKDKALEPVVINALDELLNEQRNISGTTNIYQYERLIEIIIIALGDLKAIDASDQLVRAFRQLDNEYIKAKAIMAIGKSGITDNIEELTTYLRNFNIGALTLPDQQKLNTLVYALIYALERLKSEVGFEPVFFASIGNYQREVRERAKDALLNMTEDPSAMIQSIIREYDDFEIKYEALLVEEQSSAGESGKELAAVEAIRQFLEKNPDNAREKNYRSSLLIMASNILSGLGAIGDEAIAYFNRILVDYTKYKLYSTDEILAVLNAMSRNKSDANALALSNFLKFQTDQREEGLALNDSRIVKTTIAAIGDTGNNAAMEELLRISFSETWESSVKRDANSAMEKLK